VAVDKYLSSGDPDVSGNAYGFDDAHAFVKRPHLRGLVHVSEVTFSMLKIYELDPHHTWHSRE
jgi:hypothetical protein